MMMNLRELSNEIADEAGNPLGDFELQPMTFRHTPAITPMSVTPRPSIAVVDREVEPFPQAGSSRVDGSHNDSFGISIVRRDDG